MNEHFLTYEQSLAVKELGFDEPCLSYFTEDIKVFMGCKDEQQYRVLGYSTYKNSEGNAVSAPLKSQFFKWVREKYGCVHEIVRNEDGNHSDFMAWVYIDSMKINVVSFWIPKTYEQAEDVCIDKIIEILKLK